jgi:hypothetical protein
MPIERHKQHWAQYTEQRQTKPKTYNTKKRRTDPQKTGVLEKGKQIMFFIIFSLWYSYSQEDKSLVGDEYT